MGVAFPLLATLLVFFAAFLGGLYPILAHRQPKQRRAIFYGEAFSRGIFLGIGLIHFLPEAHKHLEHTTQHSNYPYLFALCAFTIAALRFLEQGIAQTMLVRQKTHWAWQPYLLMVILSVHSIIAGTALGVSQTLADFLILLLAIISHKSAAAFALSTHMRSHHLPQYAMWRLLICFALMTPAGIVTGALLGDTLHGHSAHFTSGVFDTVAAGTFIYIAAFNSQALQREGPLTTQLFHLVWFILGLGLMSMIAFF